MIIQLTPESNVKVRYYKGNGYHVTANVALEEGCIRVHKHTFASERLADMLKKAVAQRGAIDSELWESAEFFEESIYC